MSGKWEAEKMVAAEDRKELKLAVFHICFFLSAGLLFTLLSFLIAGASTRIHFLCWQTAAVAFFAAAVILQRHPVVWSPVILRWSGQSNQKPKSAPHVG